MWVEDMELVVPSQAEGRDKSSSRGTSWWRAITRAAVQRQRVHAEQRTPSLRSLRASLNAHRAASHLGGSLALLLIRGGLSKAPARTPMLLDVAERLYRGYSCALGANSTL